MTFLSAVEAAASGLDGLSASASASGCGGCLLLRLGLAAHDYYWLVMASAGGGSLQCFPVLDGNLGRRWWGLLPSGSQLSSFRSRCRSNWAEWETVPGNVLARGPAQRLLGLAGLVDSGRTAAPLVQTAAGHPRVTRLLNPIGYGTMYLSIVTASQWCHSQTRQTDHSDSLGTECLLVCSMFIFSWILTNCTTYVENRTTTMITQSQLFKMASLKQSQNTTKDLETSFNVCNVRANRVFTSFDLFPFVHWEVKLKCNFLRMVSRTLEYNCIHYNC